MVGGVGLTVPHVVQLTVSCSTADQDVVLTGSKSTVTTCKRTLKATEQHTQQLHILWLPLAGCCDYDYNMLHLNCLHALPIINDMLHPIVHLN